MAGQKGAFLYDEVDHLGMYVQTHWALAAAISGVLPTLADGQYGRIRFLGPMPMLVRVQRATFVEVVGAHVADAETMAIAAGVERCDVLLIFVREDGAFEGAWQQSVPAPTETGRAALGSRPTG